MSKKNLKKFTAAALAATMTLGSTMMVFAEGEDSTAGVAEGTGSYEGGEMKYPTLSVTLPTIPAGTYDYIADPNGLITETQNAKYENASFSGNTGIYFETSDDTYSEKSAAQSVTNENAQDIDVTVKLEQKTAGSKVIQYAESADFEDEDTANKLYLAITDDAATDAKVAALKANGAATLTTTVNGIPGNYEAGYDATDGYVYTVKGEDELTAWNECSFILTGAINTNATWGDDVTFPAIKVTWSYAEHKESALSSSTVSGSSNVLTVRDATVTKITLVKADGSQAAWTAGTQYTLSADKKTVTFREQNLNNNAGCSLKITLSTGDVETITIQ